MLHDSDDGEDLDAVEIDFPDDYDTESEEKLWVM